MDMTTAELIAEARRLGEPSPGNGWRRLLWRMADRVEVLQRVVLDLDVDTLRHEVRTPALDALRRNRVFTLGQLVKCTPDRLHKMRNLGVSALREIVEALERRGLELEADSSPP